jgi:hypothetical protein
MAGVCVGGPRAAANERGTRGEDAGLDSMCATGAKFDHGSSGSGSGDARSFAGDEGLEMKSGEEARFDELSFSNRGSDAKQWFTREKDGSLGKGPHLTSEAEAQEVIKKVGMDTAKERLGAQIGDFLSREADVL